jgi:hypothetical protein
VGRPERIDATVNPRSPGIMPVDTAQSFLIPIKIFLDRCKLILIGVCLTADFDPAEIPFVNFFVKVSE